MTPATDERSRILQMLEAGKITADEAAALLRALDGRQRAGPAAPIPGMEGRYLRVQVNDLASGARKVNVTIPLSLVRVGLRMAERFAPETSELDLEQLEELIASGLSGKIVEVVDAEGGEQVEIYVE
jgi:hypothetical protein